MLSPLTQIAITLLHDIAMHEPHEAIGHCTSPEELRYIYTRLEQKGMICRKEKATEKANEKANEKAAEDADADTYTTCSYKLCRPLCEISLLEVLRSHKRTPELQPPHIRSVLHPLRKDGAETGSGQLYYKALSVGNKTDRLLILKHRNK